MIATTFALVVCCFVTNSFGLSCFTCDKSSCPILDEDKCPHGIALDACGCCPVCAGKEGDKCGGIYQNFGQCGAGMKCIIEVEFGLPWQLYIQMNGTCRSVKKANNSNSTNGSRNGTDVTDLDFVMNSTTPVCKIPCSVDFCRDNRNRICSANRSSLVGIEERMPCQHTTCKACRLHTLPDCPSCPKPVKKKCLQDYYLCISEHYERDDIILELDDPKSYNVTGGLICHVPEVTTAQAQLQVEE